MIVMNLTSGILTFLSVFELFAMHMSLFNVLARHTALKR